MSLWSEYLKRELRDFERLAIMCVGNKYASDDGVGPEIAGILSKLIVKKECGSVFVINCYDSPENFTSPVKKIKPSHILIIDSCISGKKPGTISAFAMTDLNEYDISTHRMPVRLLADYLVSETGSTIIILGIEPEFTGRGAEISEPVRKAIEEIEKFFFEFLGNNKKV
ncbi:MAG: hydrogenase maturation protease [Candidatus Omnitrophica bacterium]|nr:hydrogenase maturation protease [Candidatus Omnitrophota bacterium]MCM8828762.1 hydrogenase maturation protease [Candidatus Omnitrophota bacterium]